VRPLVNAIATAATLNAVRIAADLSAPGHRYRTAGIVLLMCIT
jgi:hypothetical protein